MRRFIGGNGSDTTAAVQAFLASHQRFAHADLYLIGEADDPAALWLTNWESPLCWKYWGTFQPAVITRGTISSRAGLDNNSLDISWSPSNTTITASLATMNPYQLALLGQYANKRVRVWRTIMPTPGDAHTFGACEKFMGFVGDVQPNLGKIDFSVNSFLYVLDQKVPTNLIMATSLTASYTGGKPPTGYSVMPQFNIIAGSTTNLLYADQISPNPHNVPSGNLFLDGYVCFNGGAGATLQGVCSVIANNGAYDDGHGNHYTAIALNTPLPVAPTPGVDTFYVSGAVPLNQSDGGDPGFPYVPSPQSNV
jgi:hypothetical protein